MAQIDYFGECCDKFDKMPMRAEINIETQVKPENKDLFIETVKLFIDLDYAKEKGYYLEFSNDYSKCRKLPH